MLILIRFGKICLKLIFYLYPAKTYASLQTEKLLKI